MTHEELVMEVQALKARVVSLETQRTQKADSKKPVADDADLDGEWGDPRIRYGLKAKYLKEQPDPNVGKTYSECTPEYLDITAKYLDACAYMARKDGEDKKAGYKERDASRARGWAQRKRNGWVPSATEEEAVGFADYDSQAQADAYDYGDGSDIPFIVNMTMSSQWWRP